MDFDEEDISIAMVCPLGSSDTPILHSRTPLFRDDE